MAFTNPEPINVQYGSNTVIQIRDGADRLEMVCVCVLSHLQTFVIPWTVAYQAPLSIYFPNKNTGVCCHFLLQGNRSKADVRTRNFSLKMGM